MDVATPVDADPRSSRLVEAEHAFHAGEFDRASELAEQLLADRTEEERALLILGAVALGRHRHASALEYTERAIDAWAHEGAPVPAALWHNRGIALGGLGRIDDALPALAAAVEMAPNHRQYRASLALILHAAGRQDEAFAISIAATGAPENVVAAAIAFERGDLDGCARILDIARPGFEGGIREQLSVKQWEELKTYHAYLGSLVAYRRRHPEPPGRSREPLYVIGDSHTLSPARFPVRFAGCAMVTQPRLVFGVKLWHLARARKGGPSLYAAAFGRALAALPPGATAVMSVGEIDSRADEGFLPVLRRANAMEPGPMRERIDEVVRDALDFASAAARETSVRLHVVNVPAPRADVDGRTVEDSRDVARIVAAVNEAIDAAAHERGMFIVDVYGRSLGSEGCAAPGHHLDAVHLLPGVFGQAAQAKTARRAR